MSLRTRVEKLEGWSGSEAAGRIVLALDIGNQVHVDGEVYTREAFNEHCQETGGLTIDLRDRTPLTITNQ